MSKDVAELAKLDEAVLEQRMSAAAGRIKERIARVQDEQRDLNASEQWLSYNDRDEVSAIQDALRLQQRDAGEIERRQAVEARNAEVQREIDRMRRGGVETRARHSSLVVSDVHLRSHAEAIREGRGYGIQEVEERAALTTATHLGSEGAWASPGIPEPITLRRFAGIPTRPLTGLTAQHPSLTLPAGAAGVAETAAHGEFTGAAKVDLSALRYGRWSDVSALADAHDELESLNRAHSVGVARDLNLLDGAAVIAASGAALTFAADLDRLIRQAVLTVAAATLAEPEDMVLFGTAADLARVSGYAPVTGDGAGTVTLRVHGARLYTHTVATSGFVYCFNPAAFMIFADRLRSASVVNPDTGNHRFGQWMHSTAPGVAVVGGAVAVDVVTP